MNVYAFNTCGYDHDECQQGVFRKDLPGHMAAEHP